MKIAECKTYDPRVDVFKKFFRENEQLIVLQVDKKVDLIIEEKSVYLEKVKQALSDNFKEVVNYNEKSMKKDLVLYRTLLKSTFGKSMPNNQILKLYPTTSLSDAYGTVKLHKPNEPLRLIVTSYNSMIKNSEKFLKKFLKPLVNECSYSMKNTKTCKQKFLEDKKKFIPEQHSVISIDIQKMYGSMNVVRVISIILEKVYQDPKKFFQFKDENGNLLPPPERENFKQFLLKTLRNFTKIRTPVGIFEQTQGLSMGSALSPMLANILVNNLEQKIVKNFEETGKIVHYTRYVDDSIIIIRKSSIRQFLKQINNFDEKLVFTLEEMNVERKLIYLDMLIFINEKHSLEFIKYRKNSVDTVITNFERSIVDRKYTKGGIITNIHREYHSSSSDELFLESLDELREVYERNSYPKRLVDSKINLFSPDFKKPELVRFKHTIVLEYTSSLIDS